mmetsp:Transcript_32996/g.83768  ORF Transcript_32996/g.83768 Transcript_32996/m.83768 type:complete len:137 (-) Transcript_32996:196-606(-)
MQTAVANVLGGLRAGTPSPTCNCAKALAVSLSILKSVLPGSGTSPAKVLESLQQEGAVSMGPVLEAMVKHGPQPPATIQAAPPTALPSNARQPTAHAAAAVNGASREGLRDLAVPEAGGLVGAHDALRMRHILHLG